MHDQIKGTFGLSTIATLVGIGLGFDGVDDGDVPALAVLVAATVVKVAMYCLVVHGLNGSRINHSIPQVTGIALFTVNSNMKVQMHTWSHAGEAL